MSDSISIFEIKGDQPDWLVVHQYRSPSVDMHFHRNLELYGVIEGEVEITIAGETKILKSGQMAAVNCMEAHRYVMESDAEIFFCHIGTSYLSIFLSQYKRGLLPRWLTDVDYNKRIYEQLKPLIDLNGEWSDIAELSEIKKHGVTNSILADIISHYGIREGENDNKSNILIEQVIQYIYEHSAEEITLNSLSSKFFITPKVLSRKLSRCLGMDLRVFINHIRIQKAMQMMNDPAMKDKTKEEIARMCGFKSLAVFYNYSNIIKK